MWHRARRGNTIPSASHGRGGEHEEREPGEHRDQPEHREGAQHDAVPRCGTEPGEATRSLPPRTAGEVSTKSVNPESTVTSPSTEKARSTMLCPDVAPSPARQHDPFRPA